MDDFLDPRYKFGFFVNMLEGQPQLLRIGPKATAAMKGDPENQGNGF